MLETEEFFNICRSAYPFNFRVLREGHDDYVFWWYGLINIAKDEPTY